jgi:hypothetical protein
MHNFETGLVRVEVQPSNPSCRCYFSYAEETIYPSTYVDRRTQLPVSKWYLIDLIVYAILLTHDRITSTTFTITT